MRDVTTRDVKVCVPKHEVNVDCHRAQYVFYDRRQVTVFCSPTLNA